MRRFSALFFAVFTCIVVFSCRSALAATPITTEVSLDQAIVSQDSVIELGGNIQLTSPKLINFTTSIDGKGYELSHSGQLVEVSGGANVTFNNVTLKATGGTEAVKVTNGNVTFNNGTSFAGTTTKAVDVTMNNSGTVLFSGTQFSGIDGNGSVVSIAGGTVNFNAGTNGAVRFENSVSAVAVGISGGTVNFPGTQFVGNKAGAVSITGGTVSFSGGNTFSNNTGAVNGGAISMSSGTTSFSGALVFENNTATGTALNGNGGAIYLSGGAATFGGTYTFRANNASNNGGAIYNATNNAMPEDATFTNNTAAQNGGAIYTTQSMTIDGGRYQGNNATSGSGGTIYSTNGITMSGTTLSGSSAGVDGGAVYAGTTISIISSDLRSNTAGESGGAVYSVGAATVTDSVFSENKGGNTVSGGAGGAIHCGAITATKSSFRKNNLTSGAGGAIYIPPTTSNSRIEECLFANQFTLGNGGAVFVQGNNTTIDIRRSHFEANAGGNGGALYLLGGSVEISRCTFDSNKTTGAGGAGYLKNSMNVGVLNSTFYQNESTGLGGALYLDSDITGEMSAIYYSTFVNNKGTGGGGAIYTEVTGGLYLGATAMVGNSGATVADLLRQSSSTITSLGYNIIGSYGVIQGGSITGNYQWVSDPSILGTTANKNTDIVNSSQYSNIRSTLFGSNVLATNSVSGIATVMTGSTIDSVGRVALKTIALIPTTATQVNPALDKIDGNTAQSYIRTYFTDSTNHVDERGVPRGIATPQPAGGLMADVGAFELPTEGGGGPDPGDGSISYVVMSGIPNTMVHVGQTCTLTAVVYGQNGQPTSDQNVTWASSRPRVARIDDYGNLVALSEGTTTVTVTTVAYGTNNEQKSVSKTLTVDGQMLYNNVHPDVLGRFADFNETLNAKGAQVYFLDADPSKVAADSFVEAFLGEYGVTPRQVTALSDANNVAFASSPTYGGSPKELKPSISVSAANLTGYGSLLPLRYAYSLSWADVSSMLGKTVTSVTEADIRSLFGKISLVFVAEDGGTRTVLDGKNVADALKSGALSFTDDDGAFLKLQVDALIGDAISTSGNGADSRAEMIDGILVVADNRPNSAVDGQMWLVGKAGSSVGGDGEGGGGCAGATVPALLLLLIPAGLAVRRRED